MMSGMRTSRLSVKTPAAGPVMRFNAPPTWPTPPTGWSPGPGWQPDPSWGPVPPGWHLWIDASAVGGWPPPDVRPSRLKVAMAIALCIVLGVGALVLFFSVYGDPGLNDPVAVLENNSGTGVDVALSSCGSFEVTDVRVIAEANAYADKPGPEQVVWDLRPTDPRQRMFHLGTSDVSGGSSFASLASVPAADSLFVYVYYVRASAPKGFTDRSRLEKPFVRTPSDSERRVYGRALTKKC